MEIDPNTQSKVWWRGALSAAVRGIPQGILLGAIGFGVLLGGVYLLGAIGTAMGAASVVGAASALAGDFGTFLFVKGTVFSLTALPALSLSALNPLPIIALNTVLTAVGNFLTGGDLAVAQYKQEVDHAANERRIHALETAIAPEQSLAPSPTIARILANGPRTQQSFTQAEEAARQNTPQPRTIH